jgi:uncharacterized membrane protein YkvA (DUF1232 family)
MSDIVAASPDNFGQWLVRFVKKMGLGAAHTTLMLWFAFRDPDVPAWTKAKIGAALAYVVSPIDAIPDALPGGLVDDMAVVAVAFAAVAAHVTPAIRKKADDVIRSWTGQAPDLS